MDLIHRAWECLTEFLGLTFSFFLACSVSFFIGYMLGVDEGEKSKSEIVYIPEPKKANKPLFNTRQVKTKDVK